MTDLELLAAALALPGTCPRCVTVREGAGGRVLDLHCRCRAPERVR